MEHPNHIKSEIRKALGDCGSACKVSYTPRLSDGQNAHYDVELDYSKGFSHEDIMVNLAGMVAELGFIAFWEGCKYVLSMRK